ncbi:MAG: precorrin-8X methylmutase [Nitrospirae bacterium]|nr:precorrin-8X methylmutase [Nitrospirota bacterium]
MTENLSSKGLSIETDSFKVIRGLLKGRSFSAEELQVVMRVIHATGDPMYEELMEFHPGAVDAAIRSIREGRDILVDVRMVEAGISRRILEGFGGKTICLISDDDVIETAKAEGKTRAETAMEKAVESAPGIGIVAVGNAPTALMKAMELADSGVFTPDLIVGVPVGFIMAAESKAELMKRDYPFISCRGRKGGSPVAAAVINALLRTALNPSALA